MGVTPLAFRLRPDYEDVSTFYITGVVARLGAWDALYPDVGNDSGFRVGDNGARKPKLIGRSDRSLLR